LHHRVRRPHAQQSLTKFSAKIIYTKLLTLPLVPGPSGSTGGEIEIPNAERLFAPRERLFAPRERLPGVRERPVGTGERLPVPPERPGGEAERLPPLVERPSRGRERLFCTGERLFPIKERFLGWKEIFPEERRGNPYPTKKASGSSSNRWVRGYRPNLSLGFGFLFRPRKQRYQRDYSS
ncbi:MAG: hypothetical protein RLZZ214_2507, partial [Verrucomicrobiota bacterium]